MYMMDESRKVNLLELLDTSRASFEGVSWTSPILERRGAKQFVHASTVVAAASHNDLVLLVFLPAILERALLVDILENPGST